MQPDATSQPPCAPQCDATAYRTAATELTDGCRSPCGMAWRTHDVEVSSILEGIFKETTSGFNIPPLSIQWRSANSTDWWTIPKPSRKCSERFAGKSEFWCWFFCLWIKIVNDEFTIDWLWITLSVSLVSLAAGIALELWRASEA